MQAVQLSTQVLTVQLTVYYNRYDIEGALNNATHGHYQFWVSNVFISFSSWSGVKSQFYFYENFGTFSLPTKYIQFSDIMFLLEY